MTEIVRWPDGIAPRGVAFNPRGMTFSGPMSLTGRSQVGATDAGYWMATYTDIPVAGPTRVKLFRALRAKLEGGANHILVPAFDAYQAPWPADGGPTTNENDGQTWSDDTLWSDGTGWFQPAIKAYIAAAAAARDTQITVFAFTVGELVGGEYFSIPGYGSMHVVREVISSTGSPPVYTVRIWPPLRAAIPDGVTLEFERPVCRMRLLSDDESDVLLLYGRAGPATMNFIEVTPDE